ncbi:MAG: hypothetical protein SOX33_03490 [Agathobacter sp.]|nr:hypothetical protein [Agathobacter sp.]
MYPVCTFDEIIKAVLSKYEDNTVVTIGILIADWQQDEAKQYIIDYMDRFDRKSGKYIDFYIPGYYEGDNGCNGEINKKYHPNAYVKWQPISDIPAFFLRRNETPYYFDKFLFDNFIENMEGRMGIRYTYNPMLLLVEVDRKNARGQLEFQDKLVIELDEDTNRGLRRTGELFDEIFEIAKRQVNLDRFRSGVKMYYIKGKAVQNIVSVLNGEWVEAINNVTDDVLRFRIKHRDNERY